MKIIEIDKLLKGNKCDKIQTNCERDATFHYCEYCKDLLIDKLKREAQLIKVLREIGNEKPPIKKAGKELK